MKKQRNKLTNQICRFGGVLVYLAFDWSVRIFIFYNGTSNLKLTVVHYSLHLLPLSPPPPPLHHLSSLHHLYPPPTRYRSALPQANIALSPVERDPLGSGFVYGVSRRVLARCEICGASMSRPLRHISSACVCSCTLQGNRVPYTTTWNSSCQHHLLFLSSLPPSFPSHAFTAQFCCTRCCWGASLSWVTGGQS